MSAHLLRGCPAPQILLGPVADEQQRRGVLRGAPLRGEPGRRPLHQFPRLEELVHLLGRGLVDEGAMTGAERDPAVAVQPLQRFAHRAAADSELRCQPFLDEMVARCQCPADQHLLQPFVDEVAERKGADGLFLEHRNDLRAWLWTVLVPEHRKQ